MEYVTCATMTRHNIKLTKLDSLEIDKHRFWKIIQILQILIILPPINSCRLLRYSELIKIHAVWNYSADVKYLYVRVIYNFYQ